MPQISAERRKWLFRAATLLIVALLVWAWRRTLGTAFEELSRRDVREWVQWQPGWLALAGAMYLLGMLPCGMFWQRLLAAAGTRPPLWRTLRAYVIGHLGKYVPGKALVIVLRAGLLPRQRGAAGMATVAATILIETLSMMAVGTAIGVSVLAVTFAAGDLRRSWWMLAAAVLAGLAGLFFLPRFLQWLAAWLGRGRKGSEGTPLSNRLTSRAWAVGLLGIAIGWVATGVSLWATVQGIGQDGGNLLGTWHLYTAAAALAMVLGFLSFLPGGAGVRELVLVEMLARSAGLDESVALVAAIVWRLVQLVSELAISGILYMAGQIMPGRSDTMT